MTEVEPFLHETSPDSAEPGPVKDEQLTTFDVLKDFEDSGVRFWSGPYVAVVAAAFGKVKAKTNKFKFRTLHPVFVLLLALPLFVGQLTMIFALRLDLDVNKGIVTQDDPDALFVLKLKYVMILVLQLTNFSILLSTVRILAFVANPVTWIECERPKVRTWFKMLTGKDSDWWGLDIIFHPWTSAIPCIIALIMRLTVSYLVCVDSMSIIFEADSVKSAIFNALVLNYINDLNHHYWEFIEELVHIEEKIADTRIRAQPIDAVGHRAPTANIRRSVILSGNSSYCPGCVVFLVKWFPFLSRGRGARRFENIVAFSVLFIIYGQQLFVALFARMTNVLPVARDLCTMYRWKHGESVFLPLFVVKALLWVIETATIIPLDLAAQLKDINPEDKCREDGVFFRMLWSDRENIMFNGNYTFLEVTETTDHGGLNTYKTSPVHHADNDWTQLIFGAGALFILAIMLIPQLSTLKDIWEILTWEKFKELMRSLGNCMSQNCGCQCCSSPDNVDDVDEAIKRTSIPLNVKEKFEDRAACMKRVEELQKEMTEIKEYLRMS